MVLKVHQVCGSGYDSNVYYVDAQKPILIDTGTGQHNKETLQNLDKFSSIDKISKIILTHKHADHSGGAAELSAELGVKVYAHELDGQALVEGDGASTGAIMFGFIQQKVDITFIAGGDTIDCGDLELEIIHTPGHSPGSVSLYDSESKSIFCGDLVFMDGGVGRWDLPGGEYKELVRSVEKILEREIDNFYPGHGPANEGKAKKYIQLSYEYLKSCAAFA
jgi:hydroxyacylglutathione hydrolase